MIETLAYGYSSERAQRELSNEYTHGRVLDGFPKSLHPRFLDKSSLGRVKFYKYLKSHSRGASKFYLSPYFKMVGDALHHGKQLFKQS